MTEVASTSSHVWSFHPSDECLAVDFLHPLAAGFAVPDGTRIIADDPYRVEPWKLLAAHQRDAAEGAYFFTKKVMLSPKGLRRKRTVGDAADKIVGTWRVQHGKDESNAGHRAPAGKIVRWRKTLLSYYNAGEGSKTTGYVMHEYQLFNDDCSVGGGARRKGESHECVISYVKMSDREVSRRNRRRKAAAYGARTDFPPVVPVPHPVPSPPVLPAAAEGTAEPPLNYNGETDMTMSVDEINAFLDEETMAKQQQQLVKRSRILNINI